MNNKVYKNIDEFRFAIEETVIMGIDRYLDEEINHKEIASLVVADLFSEDLFTEYLDAIEGRPNERL